MKAKRIEHSWTDPQFPTMFVDCSTSLHYWVHAHSVHKFPFKCVAEFFIKLRSRIFSPSILNIFRWVHRLRRTPLACLKNNWGDFILHLAATWSTIELVRSIVFEYPCLLLDIKSKDQLPIHVAFVKAMLKSDISPGGGSRTEIHSRKGENIFAHTALKTFGLIQSNKKVGTLFTLLLKSGKLKYYNTYDIINKQTILSMSKIWMGIGLYIELLLSLLDKNLFIKNCSSSTSRDIAELNHYIFREVCLSSSHNITLKKISTHRYLPLCLSTKVDTDSLSIHTAMFK